MEDSVTFNKPMLWRCSRERGQQGMMQKWHSDPADLPGLQTEALFSSTVQLISADPRSRVGCRVNTHFNGDGMSILSCRPEKLYRLISKQGVF